MRICYIKCRKLALTFHSLCFCLSMCSVKQIILQAIQWTVIILLSWFAAWATQTHIPDFFFNVGKQNIFEFILNPQFKYSSLYLPHITCLPDSSFLFPVSTRKISGEDIKKTPWSSLKNEGCYYCVKPTTWKTLVRIKLMRFLL